MMQDVTKIFTKGDYCLIADNIRVEACYCPPFAVLNA